MRIRSSRRARATGKHKRPSALRTRSREAAVDVLDRGHALPAAGLAAARELLARDRVGGHRLLSSKTIPLPIAAASVRLLREFSGDYEISASSLLLRRPLDQRRRQRTLRLSLSSLEAQSEEGTVACSVSAPSALLDEEWGRDRSVFLMRLQPVFRRTNLSSPLHFNQYRFVNPMLPPVRPSSVAAAAAPPRRSVLLPPLVPSSSSLRLDLVSSRSRACPRAHGGHPADAHKTQHFSAQNRETEDRGEPRSSRGRGRTCRRRPAERRREGQKARSARPRRTRGSSSSRHSSTPTRRPIRCHCSPRRSSRYHSLPSLPLQ